MPSHASHASAMSLMQLFSSFASMQHLISGMNDDMPKPAPSGAPALAVPNSIE